MQHDLDANDPRFSGARMGAGGVFCDQRSCRLRKSCSGVAARRRGGLARGRSRDACAV